MEVHARRKSSFVSIVKYFYHDRFSYVYERFIFRVVYSIAPVVGRFKYVTILFYIFFIVYRVNSPWTLPSTARTKPCSATR